MKLYQISPTKELITKQSMRESQGIIQESMTKIDSIEMLF